jgi:hypothetical protein
VLCPLNHLTHLLGLASYRSNDLDVHLLRVNNARTRFVLTNLLIGCVGVVGGMFSLSNVACSYKPFCHL